MPQRYRAQFINSLSGFKSANLVGTISDDGVTNLAMISSVFHLGADPALIGFISRPHTVTRDTLENIDQTGFYTINHCNQQIYQQGHQTAARYPADTSEFAATGLSEEYSEALPAPYVAESELKLGIELQQVQTIELNQTVLVIGQIIEVIVPEKAIEEDGQIDIESLGSVCVSGLDRYHTTNELQRLPYAKP